MWNKFPKKEDTNRIFLDLNFVDNEPVVPYQFTLTALCRVYKFLAPWPEGSDKFKFDQPSPEAAKDSPLKAAAFFSWESDSKIFLTRRVFPTFFGFLSYSHVPKGWGALGLALKEISEPGWATNVYSTVPDIYYAPLLVPYLREANRIQYKAVLVLPVFKENEEPSETTLLGAWVFYLKDAEHLPERTPVIVERLKFFAETTAIALGKHHRRMEADFPEQDEWKKKLEVNKNVSGELVIKLLPESNTGILEKLAAGIMERVINSDFHVITLPMLADKSIRILVAGREGITRTRLRSRVMNAVGGACNDCDCKEHVAYNFNFPIPEHERQIIHTSST
jgi:hypothetical protein